METKLIAMILGVALVIATVATVGASITPAKAQSQGPPSGVSTGPPTFVGNPTGLSTGPPVPNCNAVDQGNFQGPPDDTMRGCK